MPKKGKPVVIDGANELRDVRAAFWMARNWRALRKEMMQSDGYVTHHYYFKFPFTIGLVSFWADERAAYGFARQPVHNKFREWVEKTGGSTGGWLALYEYDHGGPLWGNGVTYVKKQFDGVIPPAIEE